LTYQKKKIKNKKIPFKGSRPHKETNSEWDFNLSNTIPPKKKKKKKRSSQPHASPQRKEAHQRKKHTSNSL
jgi:hypothetical protein